MGSVPEKRAGGVQAGGQMETILKPTVMSDGDCSENSFSEPHTDA